MPPHLPGAAAATRALLLPCGRDFCFCRLKCPHQARCQQEVFVNMFSRRLFWCLLLCSLVTAALQLSNGLSSASTLPSRTNPPDHTLRSQVDSCSLEAFVLIFTWGFMFDFHLGPSSRPSASTPESTFINTVAAASAAAAAATAAVAALNDTKRNTETGCRLHSLIDCSNCSTIPILPQGSLQTLLLDLES
jgi:hypothetical protein